MQQHCKGGRNLTIRSGLRLDCMAAGHNGSQGLLLILVDLLAVGGRGRDQVGESGKHGSATGRTRLLGGEGLLGEKDCWGGEGLLRGEGLLGEGLLRGEQGINSVKVAQMDWQVELGDYPLLHQVLDLLDLGGWDTHLGEDGEHHLEGILKIGHPLLQGLVFGPELGDIFALEEKLGCLLLLH